MRRANLDQQQLTLEPAGDRTLPAEPLRSPTMAAVPPIVILRLPQVCRITGLCRSLVYELEANGTFPRRVPLGARSVGWVEAEVQSWLADRVRARGTANVSRGARSSASADCKVVVRPIETRIATSPTAGRVRGAQTTRTCRETGAAR
jgi:prophage regulatory protein